VAKEKIYGYIRLRASSDEEAREIEKQFWQKANYPNIPQQQLKFEAHNCLIEYYQKKGARRKAALLIKEVLIRYSTLMGLQTKQRYEKWLSNTPLNFSTEECAKLLMITMAKGGYPHQLIAFGFNKLLRYGPQRITKELSQERLGSLFEELKNEYSQESRLPQEIINKCFRPLGDKLAESFSRIRDPHDSSTTIQFPCKDDQPTGKTCLLCYYGSDPEANISDWCNKVKEKTIREGFFYLF
jgi:hypothetical protein